MARIEDFARSINSHKRRDSNAPLPINSTTQGLSIASPTPTMTVMTEKEVNRVYEEMILYYREQEKHQESRIPNYAQSSRGPRDSVTPMTITKSSTTGSDRPRRAISGSIAASISLYETQANK